MLETTLFDRKVTLSEYLCLNPMDISLAAGFFGFYAHIGFLKALHEKGVPIKENIYGSSAGALVGAMLAAGLSVSEIEKIVLGIKIGQYWDPRLGLGLLRGEKLHRLLEQYLPSKFEDLKYRFAAAVFDLKKLSSKVISSGDLISAVRASSAFPGLFQPVKIGSSFYIDGGIGDEYGLGNRSSENFLLVHGFAVQPLFSKSYEKLKKQKSNFLHLHSTNLKKASPFNMDIGFEIIQQSYRQMGTLLEKPLDHFVIK